MEFFQSYKIVRKENSTELILYIHRHETEFSEEFGSIKHFNAATVQKAAQEFVKERLPNIEIKTVKIMAGSLLVTTLTLNPPKAEAATDFNMGYLYFGSTSTFIESIDRTQGAINVASPSYFDINQDGSLKITSKMDRNFVTEMHRRGVKVVPFLSNHWNREVGRKALSNKEQLSSQIAEAIETYNLDGVNVDIENVSDIDRTDYTEFVRLLRQKIPSHKEVSVAVAANPNGWTKGWHGSYDYHELAKYSDYLMIMAYDESFPGGPEGPVASIGFVEKSIKYALSQDVPADKIVIGLPHYGRYWVKGATTGGSGITIPQVESMLKKYEHTLTYDETAQSPKAIVTIKPGDPATIINGITLKPGVYTIWYESEQSIKAKVDLVTKYHLKGTGSWSLGQENASIWYKFNEWINDAQYKDINSDNTQKPDSSEVGITERISGKNRFEVAVNVAKKGWPNSANTVFLSNYNAYADALSAAPLAYKEDAPILLTHKDHLTSETKEEIMRLKTKNIIIIGGPGSIGDEVINELKAVGITTIKRIGGKDRFEVSKNIAATLGPADTAIIADGLNFPDALAIAPYAARNGYPILLANKNTLPSKTKEAIIGKNIKNTIVVGGESSVGQSVFNELPSPFRISGKDRFEVAANIIHDLKQTPKTIYIATGLSFADALTGSVLAAKNDAALLLTQKDKLPNSTETIIKEKHINNKIILGGTSSVSEQVSSELSK